jgi:hypothetical protein
MVPEFLKLRAKLAEELYQTSVVVLLGVARSQAVNGGADGPKWRQQAIDRRGEHHVL